MKIFLHNYLFILVMLSFCLPSTAREIKKIGVEDGLSNINVISIAQDRDGFIWCATKDGLNRFDFNTFKVFKASDSIPNTVCSNLLNAVYADKFDDIVWIASEKSGIDAYNYATHTFTHYEHQYNNPDGLIADGVTHITGDEKGNLWLATYQSGIEYFDKTTGKFSHYNKSNVKGLVSDFNWYVLYDEENQKLFAGHVNDGFSIIDIKTRTAVNFKHDPNDPNSLAGNTVTCIYKDSRKNIWLGTLNGLTLFNQETFQMTNFYHDPKNPQSLSDNAVKSILETDKSDIWFGTEGGGVNIMELYKLPPKINPTNIKFKRIEATDMPDGLSSASVQNILQDSFGNIWLGGYVSGINFISSKEPFFNKISYLPYINNKNSLNDKIVTDICALDNNVWIANGNGGINVFNKNKKIKSISELPGLGHIDATVAYQAPDNTLWFGTGNGHLFYYNATNDKFTIFDKFTRINGLSIRDILVDKQNNIWVCTDLGIHFYDSARKMYKVYTTQNSLLPDNVTRSIEEDASGNIWVGTLIGGLSVFSKSFERLYEYGNVFDFYGITDIYKDSQNRIWVGSQNDLFLFKDYSTESVLRLGQKDGLPGNFIRAIIEGETADNIWFSTINGISHFHLKTASINNFTVNDGIIQGDYNNRAITKTADGTIFMGSQQGATYFKQKLIPLSNGIPEAAITNFAIPNIDNKNITEFIDIPFSKDMKLNYNQNSIQIDFNVMDYALTDKVEFMFELAGLDDKWYIASKDKKVTFRNLKPGTYFFSLKTRLHDKEWSDNMTTMRIIITPPLWATNWAKAFYVIIILSITVYIIRFYKNKLKIESALYLEKKTRQQEKDLNEEKLKFFTNITHELRSPMTLILGPLEDLITDKSIDATLTKKLTSVYKVANRLLQLINQILEFRKSETNSRKLMVIKGDFNKHLYEIGLKYKELKKNKEISFDVKLPKTETQIFYDPEVVTIILDNLLSNAFKYTITGNISMSLKHSTLNNVDYTEVIISDTGLGISEEDLPHIFERYYQARNTKHPISGTGIGLALVKRMIDLHEAEIDVRSTQEEGTTFTVKFLTNNTYPEALHIDTPEKDTDTETQDDSKEVILVVDDNPEITEYISDCLIDSFTVLTADNGKSGFDLATEKVPDIIISDIMMPVMDGIEMCKLMKQDVRTSHIPVVLLTAKGSIQDKSEGYKAGADSYLTKPFSGNLLRSRLNNMLEARKRLSESHVSKLKDKKQVFSEATNKLDQEFLEQLTSVIEENLEDEDMNISKVASFMNMSHSTLYRKIKGLTNLTANEYIRKVRMNVAEQLLLTNKYSISEVMYKVGINSNGYFRRCFKEEFGQNPSDYLQNLKEE